LQLDQESQFWFEFAESQGKTVAQLLGFADVGYTSENECDWWIARWTRVNFLTGEVNRSGQNPANLLRKNFLEDQTAVDTAMKKGKEAHAKRMKDAKNG
jgi:hypothetical protein